MSDSIEAFLNNSPEKEDPKNTLAAEVEELYKKIKVEFPKYLHFKTIEDTLEDWTCDSDEDNKQLRAKVKNIMLESACEQSSVLDELNQNKLLGITEIKDELNYTERIRLKQVLECSLTNKFVQLELSNMSINKSKQTKLLLLDPDDNVLIEYKQKLQTEQELYIQNLMELMNLLQQIYKLRTIKLPEVTEHKILKATEQSSMYGFRSKILQQKARVDIFKENSKSLDAYETFIKDLKEQQEDCRKDIEALQDLKERYKQVSCRQYEEMLKTYLVHKSAFEKKKQMYECLNK